MSSNFIKWSLFVLLCFIWGSSFILMKIGKEGLSAPQVAALRIFSASIVFVPYSIYSFIKIPRAKWGYLFVTGLTGNLLPAFLFTAAITKIDSSLAGILNSLTPVSVVLIGVLFFRAVIRRQQILGIAIGFAGLCLLFFGAPHQGTADDGDTSTLILYSLLVVLATISYGINTNVIGTYIRSIHPVQAVSVSLAFMAIPSGIIAWQLDCFSLNLHDATVQSSIIASVLLGLAGTAFANVLFYFLVQKGGALFASLVTYGVPLIAICWGLLYHETIGFTQIIALLIILTGVYLANRRNRNGSSH